MSNCIDDEAENHAQAPLWDAQNKGYHKDELTVALDYLDKALKWMNEVDPEDTYTDANGDTQTYGILADPEDVCMLRVGVPYKGKDKAVDADTIYGADNVTKNLLRVIGLDGVKITKKGKPHKQYTFKRTERREVWEDVAADPKVQKNDADGNPLWNEVGVIHRIIGRYHYKGLDNRTGFQWVDDWYAKMEAAPWPSDTYPEGDPNDLRDTTKSIPIATNVLPTRYNGVLAVTVPEELPEDVVRALTYVAQNPLMVGKLYGLKWWAYDANDDRVGDGVYDTQADAAAAADHGKVAEDNKSGDIMVITLRDMIQRLVEVRIKARQKLVTLPTLYQDSIQEILEVSGMAQAFKDTQYGADIADLRIMMRIPASRYNQEILEKMVHKPNSSADTDVEYFKKCLKVRWYLDDMTEEDRDNAAAGRKSELEDVCNTDMGNYNLLDVDSGNYGCWRNTTEEVTSTDSDGVTTTTTVAHTNQRYFVVYKSWFEGLTAAEMATVYFMGLDLQTDMTSQCGLDTMITVVIIVVMTIVSAGSLSGWAYALAVTSAVISVGLTLGVFGDGAMARDMAVVAAVLALASGGVNLSTAANATTGATIGFAMQVVNTVINVKTTIEKYEFDEEMKSLQEQTKQYGDDAEMYESSLRMQYGESYENHIRNGIETDPYKEIRDRYSEFALYKQDGFM